jgi:hypothetical protein
MFARALPENSDEQAARHGVRARRFQKIRLSWRRAALIPLFAWQSCLQVSGGGVMAKRELAIPFAPTTAPVLGRANLTENSAQSSTGFGGALRARDLRVRRVDHTDSPPPLDTAVPSGTVKKKYSIPKCIGFCGCLVVEVARTVGGDGLGSTTARA